MEKNKTQIKTQILLLLILGIAGLWIYKDYIFGNRFLVFKDVAGDTNEQYIMQFGSIVNHIKAGHFSFWDFTNGLGTNQFNYNLYDPAFMFIVLMGVLFGTGRMLYFLAPLQILKIILAGLAGYHFFSEFSFSERAKLAVSAAYGLNGFLLIWGQHYFFGTIVIYYPLMLLFCERFIQKKKGCWLFPVTVCLSSIYSVYFTYMALIGTGFYLLIRLAMQEDLSFIKWLKRFLKGCMQIILGIGMGAFAFLPMANILLHVTSRLSNEQNQKIIEWIKTQFTFYPLKYYRTLLIRLFSDNVFNMESIAGHDFAGYKSYFEDPIFFVSVLCVLFNLHLVLVFWKRDISKRVKIGVYSTVILMIFTVVLPFGATAFNGFSDNSYRYTFVFMPILLLGMAWTWTDLEKGEKINFLSVILFLLLFAYVIKISAETVFLQGEIKNLKYLVLTTIIGITCIIFLQFFNKGWKKQILFLLLGFSLIVNLISEGAVCYEQRYSLKKKDVPLEEWQETWDKFAYNLDTTKENDYVDTLYNPPQNYFRELYQPDIQALLMKIKKEDSQFYRVEKNFASVTTSMDSLIQGYRGISTYSSVLNRNLDTFFQICFPEIYALNGCRYTYYACVEKNELAGFLGVRYLISRRNMEVDLNKYEKIAESGEMILYKNKAEAETAKFYTKTISEENLKQYYTDDENGMQILSNLLAIKDGDTYKNKKNVQSASKQAEEEKESAEIYLDAPQQDDVLQGKLITDSSGYALFMIPYEDGWELTLNGEKTEIIRGNLGFIACKVNPGDYDVELTFHVPKLKEGILISTACWLLFVLGIVWEKKKHKNK